jgi:nucleotide-binding universal stress UspA family protein
VLASQNGPAADGLIAYAARVNADLIAVGTHNKGLIHRMVLGSTTTTLLRHAPLSILAVPAAG